MSNRSASCSAGAVVLLAVASVAAAAGDAPLVQAARERDHVSVRALLAAGADVHASQPDGTTALHWAAHWDEHDTADLLIRAAADVNAVNELGATPLWLSSVHGGAAMIERLLQAGADAERGAAQRRDAADDRLAHGQGGRRDGPAAPRRRRQREGRLARADGADVGGGAAGIPLSCAC